MKSPAREAREAMERATKVLTFLKEHCPEEYQRALDYVDGIHDVCSICNKEHTSDVPTGMCEDGEDEM